MGAPVKILCILVLLLHKSQPQTFNDQKTLDLPDNYTIGWMAAVDNDTLISNITIPGTHDTMALYGGPAAECQSWSLENQLKAGIRYLDFRVSGENLRIVHGLFNEHTTFPEALRTIKTFLSNYTTETVLVRVKPVDFNTMEVLHLVEEVIHSESPESWVNESLPKIREVRGKVVFVQKNTFKLGVRLFETDKEDDYKVTNIQKKKDTINAHLNEALVARKDGKVVLNYSSGTGWPVLMLWYTPKYVAEEINPWLCEYLDKFKKSNPKACFGIIAMDFPGLDLIQKVIEFNK